MAEYFARNSAWAKKQDSYQTALAPEQETQFRGWLSQNKDRLGYFKPDNPKEDYDLRGYWLENGNAAAPARHFPDTYKTPYHETFSNESQYATQNAPAWFKIREGWSLIDSAGTVLKQE